MNKDDDKANNPEEVQYYCDKKNFKRPVSWLMGRELLAGLKWIMAYAFIGDKLDSRDWMNPAIITPPRSNNGGNEPYWFDYIADTGDGMSAVYNIAYLCMSELWLDAQGSIGSNNVALTPDATCTLHLPRGEFLFVGGDTAYHIADTASLKERFQTPFNCAYLDIVRTSKAVDQRPIYGAPANHDYYDALDGFNRQFCKPIADDTHNPLLNDPKDPQLGLLGFERTQTASYLALQLPFDWWLWGLDSQDGKIDKRQQAFFVATFLPGLVTKGELFNKDNKDNVHRELQERAPAKLIVTTPEPSTVFSKWAKPDASIVETFERIGLEPSFLQAKNGILNRTKCRLDISGDIHHYERYWGSSQNNPAPANYASVVAGGGGAFLHPSHTDINEVAKQALYPSRKDSHTLMTQALLNPWNIFHGGYVWLFGAFIAFLSYFAVTIPQSTWSLFKLMPENLRPPLLGTALLSTIRTALNNAMITQSSHCCSGSYYYDLIYIVFIVVLAGSLVYWLSKPSNFEIVQDLDAPTWLRSISLLSLGLAASCLPLVSLILSTRDQFPNSFLAGLLIDCFFIAALLLFSLSRRYSDILIKRSKLYRETLFQLTPLWLLGLLGITYAAFGFLRYGIYTSSVMSFDLMMAIVWFLSTIGLVALAVVLGGQLLNSTGKIKFAAIGVWHSVLQVLVPVCLLLYVSWTNILIISVIAIIQASAELLRDNSVKAQTIASKRFGDSFV
jgi:hypothetical protein